MKVIFDETENTKWLVNKNGEVFGIRNGKEYKKKGSLHSRGYVYIRTTNGNYQLHRLVASAFLPNTNNKSCINHKDGDKTNNKLSNLEWVTHKENYEHSIKNKLFKQPEKNSGKLKYTNKQCKKVLEMIEKGITYKKAGEKYNMPYSTVAHLVRGSRRLII